jgi:hypothetical protein
MNSLYGRFGMDDNFNIISIIENDYTQDFENKNLDDIIDIIDLDRYKLYITKSNEVQDESQIHNVSVGIASAITAYSRIHMTQFKNNRLIRLFYTDTDSIYTDSIIPDYFIDNKVLGKLKLEHICKKAIFLAPKMYLLQLIDGKIITKTKGLKISIQLTLEDFNSLLFKDNYVQKRQEK